MNITLGWTPALRFFFSILAKCAAFSSSAWPQWAQFPIRIT